MKKPNPIYCAVVLCSSLLGSKVALAEDQTPVSQESHSKEPSTPPHWYEQINLSAFIDAYASINLNQPKPQAQSNLFHAYDGNNGFSLHWIGLDAQYSGDNFGTTLNLRLGPSAIVYAGTDAQYGLEYVKQAYATWKPTSSVAIDFGKFDQPYGAEVPDSQLNMNYSRGFLYWLGQPLFFSGIRATYVTEHFNALAFAANGWNNTVDNNQGKTVGVQLGIIPVPEFSLKLGYVVGAEQPDYEVTDTAILNHGKANQRRKHLADALINFNPSKTLSFVLNGDVGAEQVVIDPVTLETEDQTWWGIMLGGRYAISDMFAASLRGEYYADPYGHTTGLVADDGTGLDVRMYSATATFEVAPDPHLLVRLEGRTDIANENIFTKSAVDTTDVQPTVILGVVGKTN